MWSICVEKKEDEGIETDEFQTVIWDKYYLDSTKKSKQDPDQEARDHPDRILSEFDCCFKGSWEQCNRRIGSN